MSNSEVRASGGPLGPLGPRPIPHLHRVFNFLPRNFVLPPRLACQLPPDRSSGTVEVTPCGWPRPDLIYSSRPSRPTMRVKQEQKSSHLGAQFLHLLRSPPYRLPHEFLNSGLHSAGFWWWAQRAECGRPSWRSTLCSAAKRAPLMLGEDRTDKAETDFNSLGIRA